MTHTSNDDNNNESIPQEEPDHLFDLGETTEELDVDIRGLLTGTDDLPKYTPRPINNAWEEDDVIRYKERDLQEDRHIKREPLFTVTNPHFIFSKKEDVDRLLSFSLNAPKSNYYEAITSLKDVGFDLIPTQRGSKNLKSDATGKSSANTPIPACFEVGDNVSIRLGSYVSGPMAGYTLVDLDLECGESQSFAFYYLKRLGVKTLCFGRQSAQKNHYLFKIATETANALARFYTPGTYNWPKSTNLEGGILELKRGSRVLAPPSWHPNNGRPEQLFWMSDDPIAILDAEGLRKISNRIVAGSIFTRLWSKGSRNTAVFTISSWLAKSHWKHEETLSFLNALFDTVNLPSHDRMEFEATVKQVYIKIDTDSLSIESMAGFGQVKSLFGDDIARHLQALLTGRNEQLDSATEELNQLFFICRKDGKIYKHSRNFVEEGFVKTSRLSSYCLVEMTMNDLRQFYANRSSISQGQRKNGEDKMASMADVWITSPQRREVADVIFDPNKPIGFFQDVDLNNDIAGVSTYFNTWTGWPYPPEKGDWVFLRNFLMNGICDGDEFLYNWLLKLLALKFQNPGILTEVCPILWGPNGVGKSFFTDFILANLFGMDRSIIDANYDHLLNNFNAQFKGTFLTVFPEVTVKGQNAAKVQEALKKLITTTHISVTEKGKDTEKSKNFLQLFVTANNPNGVPMAGEMRRYVFIQVGSRYRNDAKAFQDIEYEFLHGGAQAFMYHLLYEVNIAGELPYEELDLNEEYDHEEIARILANRRRRAIMQRDVVVRTMPITEELMEARETHDTFETRYVKELIEYGYIHPGKIILDPSETFRISKGDYGVRYEMDFPEGMNQTKLKSFRRKMTSVQNLLLGKKWKSLEKKLSPKHDYSKYNMVNDAGYYQETTRNEMAKMLLETCGTSIETLHLDSTEKVGQLIYGIRQWANIRSQSVL